MTAVTDATEIASYLKNHPEFFDQYAELLAQINIPNPHGGKAISITERQMGTLRDKVKQLESKLAELIRFGEENDRIAGKVHQLGIDLQVAHDFGAVMRALYSHLGEAFAVPHIAIRIWGVGQGDCIEFAAVDEGIRSFANAARLPYCGTAAGQPAVVWLGEVGSHIRSVAQIPLRNNGFDADSCFGLLLLASEEAQRFYPEMGTLYLEQIGDIAGAALRRVLS